MSTSIWDDPEISAGGEFVKFDNPGDSVSGVIQAIRKHTFDDGKVVPQVMLLDDSGEERTMTAGQIQLKAKLAELRPGVGDHITVTFTENEKRAGGKTLKHFTVVVGAASSTTPASAPAAAPVPAPVEQEQAPQLAPTPAAPAADPAALAAALSNLTAEQRAALGV